MTAKRSAIVDAIDAAQPIGPAAPLATDEPHATLDGGDREDAFSDYAGDEQGPSDSGAGSDDVDANTVEMCSTLDHSDTDNGLRLRHHYGRDLVVLEQEGARNTDFFTWSGAHWDMVGGNDAALRTAQKIGRLIGFEAPFLRYLPEEEKAIEEGGKAHRALTRLIKSGDKMSDDDEAEIQRLRGIIKEGDAAKDALKKRKAARRKFAVSSKNKARLEAMLACAAPHLTVKPDRFNADRRALATKNHTLRFALCPDLESPDFDEVRLKWDLEVIEGHRREDLITKLVPIAYDPEATCPKWDAFLAEFLPVEPVRRTVQTYSGLGLTGEPIQKLMFHYGLGANGKSVFMEVLARLLDALAVGLPAESLVGTGERSGQQASPDIARLYGARLVRVHELPPGAPLKEDLVKKLTGSEKIPVRALFKGFFDFQPVFKAHMSGNGYPRIDGTDNGIWRRMIVIHWPVTLPPERQRNFEDVVTEFMEEAPGILNWLIAGALTYYREGTLHLPEEVIASTQEMRDEMDDVGEFLRACVVATDGVHVQASIMYDAYERWAMANAKKPKSQTAFGRALAGRLEKDGGRIRHYLNCDLRDVPPRPGASDSEPRNPYEGRE